MKIKLPWQRIRLIRSCLEFAELKLWNQYFPEDFFVVETPDAEPAVVSIMGAGGQEFGLNICTGKKAFDYCLKILKSKGEEGGDLGIEMIGFTLDYYRALGPDEKRWFKAANFRPKKNQQVPVLLKADPQSGVNLIETPKDQKFLEYVVRGVVGAYESGDFAPCVSNNDTLTRIRVWGDVESPNVEVSLERYPQAKAMIDYLWSISEDNLDATEFSNDSVDWSKVPDDDDLDGWLDVQWELAKLFADYWKNCGDLKTPTASQKFFGDENWDYFVREYEDRFVMPGYVNWGALVYQSKANRTPYAQMLLRQPLAEPLEIALKSLMDSYPSVYRVLKVNRKKSVVDIEDLLCGTVRTVSDSSLADFAKPGYFVTVWVYQCGHFHFAELAGPILPPENELIIRELIQKYSIKADPSWLRKNAHLWGHLWYEYDNLNSAVSGLAGLMDINNPDRKLFMVQFSCANQRVLTRALEKNSNVESLNPELGDYLLYEDRDDFSKEYERQQIGYIMVPKEAALFILVIKTESQMQAARQWLENIRGVDYIQHLHRSVHEFYGEFDELDAQGGDEGGFGSGEQEFIRPDEGFESCVNGHFRDYYMQWLDEPLPILKGKTPRQCATTKKGRKQVRKLIKEIPVPNGQFSVVIPYEAMLRELGLED